MLLVVQSINYGSLYSVILYRDKLFIIRMCSILKSAVVHWLSLWNVQLSIDFSCQPRCFTFHEKLPSLKSHIFWSFVTAHNSRNRQFSGARRPDDGGMKCLCNVGQFLADKTVQHLRRQSSFYHRRENLKSHQTAFGLDSHCIKI
jgi:hypothetical protein